MSQPFVGEVRIFPYNFAPKGWAFCDGQVMLISQNTQLFAVLQTLYGGNGTTTFALPRITARSVLGVGQGPGLSSYNAGDTGGSFTVALTAAEGPVHTHTFKCVSPFAGDATTNTPAPDAAVAKMVGVKTGGYSPTQTTPCVMHAQVIGASNVPTGADRPLPHANVMPFLGLNYCIALEGVPPTHP